MKRLKYENIFFFGSFHILAIATVIGLIFFFDWRWLILTAFSWTLMGLGLGIGFHRLLIHQGFKTPRWVEITLTICGYLAMQGKHLKWIAQHWLHHDETETALDPHSPRSGLLHSHIGWMVYADPSLDDPALVAKYAKKLSKDPFHSGINKIWWLPGTIYGITLFIIGGVPALLAGLFLPVTLCFHFTWSVNSIGHWWGSQPNDTGDDSRNNLLVALVSWGEGWHNNHHDDPARARHGLRWYQIDICWYVIWALGKLNLAHAIRL